MPFKGSVGPMGRSLTISDAEADWFITIATIEVSDSSSRSKLSAYNNKAITRDVLERLLPNWRNWQWRQIAKEKLPPFLPSVGESSAKDESGLYSITISGIPGSSLTHEQVKERFQNFMEGQAMEPESGS